LLHALVHLAPTLRLRLSIAHVNHGVRPDAADDAAFVEQLGRSWRVPVTVVACDVPRLVEAEGRSVEDAARRLRYDALQRVHREREDVTSWLEYVALAVLDTLQRTLRRIEQLAVPASAQGMVLTRQQERLLLELRERAATIDELQRILGVARVQVYRILRPLVSRRLLQKSTSRPVVYRVREPRG
jgi:hypothetical protein